MSRKFASMQGRSPSMSPLGSLSARGIHYNPSPLGRSASFISVSSDKSSTFEPSEGPLGSGALIPAAYPPRSQTATPRQNGSTPRNGVPPRPSAATPQSKQTGRNGSMQKTVPVWRVFWILWIALASLDCVGFIHDGCLECFLWGLHCSDHIVCKLSPETHS